jgi:GPN-loop GTPase
MTDNEPERFEITEEDLLKHAESEGPSAGTIPVIQRLRDGIKTPTCVIVVGMAGSGKSTLMAQLQRSLEDQGNNIVINADTPSTTTNAVKDEKELSTTSTRKGYCLNLDPATLTVPFGASIDIRDTVDYKQVMKQHNLGPNGAIMTSLNLFATKFDQVLAILEKRANEDFDYILVDTPGQIEAFTWSASGTIMSESLASAFPTVLVFVVDTVRCASSPNTFMSNMLYACSMLYRTRLPLVVVFNKIDVVPHDFCVEWMQDYETFQDALDEMQSNDSSAGFYGSLTRSLSLVLDEFYRTLHTCGVSAATGEGMQDFWTSVDAAAKDFETDYLQDLKLRMQEQSAKQKAIAKVGLEKLKHDIEQDSR